jgi:ATP-dependent protease ClpP protease subunit
MLRKKENRNMPEDIYNKVIKAGRDRLEVKFNRVVDDSPVEMMIYQDIGDDPFSETPGFTAKDFAEALKDVPKDASLDIRINSAGGSVWEGMAIKTLLDERGGRKTASIDGMAASTASWMMMGVDEIRAPRHAQMFIHEAWGLCMGSAEDMRQNANELDKTSQQVAAIYSKKTKKTLDQCRNLMKSSTLMTGEEMLEHGFIDRLTDDAPVQNFTVSQIENMKSKLAVLNMIKNKKQETKIMNRKQKIALLNKWGVSTSKNATDAWIDSMIAALTPLNKAVFENGKDGKHSDGCTCNECGTKNAPMPNAEHPDPDSEEDSAPGKEGELFKAATENLKKATARMDAHMAGQRKALLQESFNKLVSEGKIGGNDIPEWMNLAIEARDSAEGVNPIIERLNKLAPQLPGIAPLNIEVGDPANVEDLDKVVNKLMESQAHFSRNARGPENLSERLEISNSSKQVSMLINRLKKYEGGVKKNSLTGELPQLVGPLVDMWNRWAASPRNANVISAGLQRQVILSEVMRAFRRQFASLEIFSHNFGSVPLEGTDLVYVPYYPLDTTASSEFVAANGYTLGANTNTNQKSVLVGGAGLGAATAGSGRKYKALQFTAYQIRRQPWLDIQKLSVLAGEQLAVDVRADILGTWINAANFGNAIFTGNSAGFDHTIVGNVLLTAAIKAFWPLRGRHVVLAPQYYTNLAIDPGITPLLAIGTTEVLREGIVGGLYGFENIIHDPLIPVVNNTVRGGDGANVAGTDPYSAGFMAYPSALLIATAPIMPPPGVLKKLVAYEQITDDQTGLAFTYQFWGDEAYSRDNEIIECCYGSGLGELAALFRLTSQGL